jgi:hypothetical protein
MILGDKSLISKVVLSLMCIQYVKVRLLYTNREILATLKNCPAN